MLYVFHLFFDIVKGQFKFMNIKICSLFVEMHKVYGKREREKERERERERKIKRERERKT